MGDRDEIITSSTPWVIAYDPDGSTKHLNPVYEKDDWAKGFDVVVHDECSADVKDFEPGHEA